ncbi:chromosomal replication initiator protein DnaA [Alphaproteobacteria bacterium]|nr:chromosomal replication initiator protein DnaA [Alphaproteobacteria bacterium]MDC3173163.1 chromosomal replication initiator protein DnaA [Alphaproteobacteria bacterium]
MEDELHQGGIDVSWSKITSELKKSLDKDTFQNWIKPIYFESHIDTSLTLSVPTRFLRDWIIKNYASVIKKAYMDQGHSIDKLAILVKENNDRIIPGTEVIYEDKDDDEDTYYDDISAPLDPKFTFDNFIVGKPNELAYAAAQRVAQSEVVSFNPLFLYGGVGLGKTHLMHAVAWNIKKRNPKKNVVYLTAEKFMYQFIKALRFKNIMSFKEQFRSVDVLMIDDVQFIIGKDNTQEEFFHTFNTLIDKKRQIIISADKSPADLDGLEDRLKSRLGWGLVADIHPLTYELRLGILQAKAEQKSLQLKQEVMEFLANKITNNVREMEGALNRLAVHASIQDSEISVDLVKDVLKDLLRTNSRKITIDEIQKKVVEHYNIKLSDMHSPRRSRSVARPRQVAMYLAKSITTRSLPEIGRKFGGRDHTTVIHAIKTIEEIMVNDPNLAEDIELLTRILQTS